MARESEARRAQQPAHSRRPRRRARRARAGARATAPRRRARAPLRALVRVRARRAPTQAMRSHEERVFVVRLHHRAVARDEVPACRGRLRALCAHFQEVVRTRAAAADGLRRRLATVARASCTQYALWLRYLKAKLSLSLNNSCGGSGAHSECHRRQSLSPPRPSTRAWAASVARASRAPTCARSAAAARGSG